MGLIDDIGDELSVTSYRHAWRMAKIPGLPNGYDPYKARCPFSDQPKHPDDCNCNGAGFLEHKKQQSFHESDAPYRALISGGGGGKTLSGAAEMIKYCMENPGARVMIVAPTFPMLNRAAAEYFIPMLPPGLLKSKNDQRHEIVLTNGCKIWLASLDNPDSIRGPTVAAIWGDEASYFEGESFDLLLFRLRQVGYPLKLWLTTTPRGKNYVYKYFVDAPSKDEKLKKDWWYVQFKTEDNPYFPRRQLAALKAKVAGTLWGKQELDGEFVAFAGQIYPQFDPNIHVSDWQKEYREGRLQFKEIMYGVDWGYTDPTVILVAGIDEDRRIYILDELYRTNLSMEEVVAEARLMVAKWGPGRFVCDSAGQTQIATFNKAGLPSHDAYKPIHEGITMTAARFLKKADDKPRLFVDKSCVQLIKEIEVYHFKELKEGDNSKPEPAKGQNDHAMDAMRYIVMDVDGGAQSWSYVKNQSVLDAINRKSENQGGTHASSLHRLPSSKDMWRSPFRSGHGANVGFRRLR
jgi:phage terminase large subunit-like protein